MTFRAQSPTISLKTGRTVRLDRPFVAGTRRPSGGWHATFRINGTDLTFNGKTPQEVAAKVQKTHYDNGITLSAADVWLNLNLQWMERLDQAYFQVDKGVLTKAILEEGEKRVESLRKGFEPSRWGSRAWNWMALYLAQDHYDPAAFMTILEQVLGMLNPNVNPTLGCIRCHGEWSNELQKIRLQPPATQEDARKWLHAVHNSVNARLEKPSISYAQACVLNFWS